MTTLICMLALASVGSNVTFAILHVLKSDKAEDNLKILPSEISHDVGFSKRTSALSSILTSEDVESQTSETKRDYKSEAAPSQGSRKSELLLPFNVNQTESSKRST